MITYDPKNPLTDDDLKKLSEDDFFSYLNKRKDEKNENYVPQLEKVYLFAFTGFAFMYAVLNFDLNNLGN